MAVGHRVEVTVEESHAELGQTEGAQRGQDLVIEAVAVGLHGGRAASVERCVPRLAEELDGPVSCDEPRGLPP